jgi:hypothetical protein
MENIINTNYKKKYLKYKNKYHKLIKNNKLKGGEVGGMTIIAIILTLFTILGVGAGVAIKNDWIYSEEKVVAEVAEVADDKEGVEEVAKVAEVAEVAKVTDDKEGVEEVAEEVAEIAEVAEVAKVTDDKEGVEEVAEEVAEIAEVAEEEVAAEVKELQEDLIVIQKIGDDGLCQFYAIIHQLLEKSEEELNKLENRYIENYKSFNEELIKNIKAFIEKIIEQKKKNPTNIYEPFFENEILAENLKELMILFIEEHKDAYVQFCEGEDVNEMTYELLLESPIDNSDKIEHFKTRYRDKINLEWGNEVTLLIIAVILGLKVNLYKNEDNIYKIFQEGALPPAYLVDENNECFNLVEIDLLFKKLEDGDIPPKTTYHYESIIQKNDI